MPKFMHKRFTRVRHFKLSWRALVGISVSVAMIVQIISPAVAATGNFRLHQEAGPATGTCKLDGTTDHDQTANLNSKLTNIASAGTFAYGCGKDSFRSIEQQINIINQKFTTSSATYEPTDNRLGLFHWDKDKFSNPIVYYEVIASRGSGVIDTALFSAGGTQVASSTLRVTPVFDNSQRYRSGPVSLSDDTDYSVKVKADSGGLNASLQAARLIIVQKAADITKTQTQVEIGDNFTKTGNAANGFDLDDPKIWKFEPAKYDPVPTYNLSVTIKHTGALGSAQAILWNKTDSRVVATTPATTSTSFVKQNVSFTFDTTNANMALKDSDDEFVLRVNNTNATGITDVAEAKVEINQSGTINKLQTMQQQVNTAQTTSNKTYTKLSMFNHFSSESFVGVSLGAEFESTIKTQDDGSLETAYASTQNRSITTVDTLSTGSGNSNTTSHATNTSGNPRISYYDYGTGNLKYAFCDSGCGTDAGWLKINVQTTGNVGEFSSIALDSSGNPRISYYNKTDQKLMYAFCDGDGLDADTFPCNRGVEDSNSEWRSVTVDDVGLLLSGSKTTSLLRDASGNPRISYYDKASDKVKYAFCNSDCGNASMWTTTFVASADQSNSLALNSSGNPRLSYPLNNNLQYAFCNGDGADADTIPCNKGVGAVNAEWIELSVVLGGVFGGNGSASSIALNSSGNPRISFKKVDNTGDSFIDYAICDLSCDNSLNWSSNSIDPVVTNDPTSLMIDIDKPRIAHHESSILNTLNFLICDASCSSAANWTKIIIDKKAGDDGTGRGPSLSLSSGIPSASYLEADVEPILLKYVRCTLSNCMLENSTTSISYKRARQSGVTLSTTDYDTYLRNSSTDTTSISNSWLVLDITFQTTGPYKKGFLSSTPIAGAVSAASGSNKWIFKVREKDNCASGVGAIRVDVYEATVSGGVLTVPGPAIFSQTDTADVLDNNSGGDATSGKTYTFENTTAPANNFSTSEYLYIEYSLNVTSVPTTACDSQFVLEGTDISPSSDRPSVATPNIVFIPKTINAANSSTPTGTALSTSSIRWSWTDINHGDFQETSYSVRDGAVEKCNTTAGASSTVNATITCDEGTLSANTQYSRTVVGINAAGIGDAGDTATRYTLSNQVTGFTATAPNWTTANGYKVDLSWGLNGATGFKLTCVSGGSCSNTVLQDLPTSSATSFAHTGLSSNTLYSYKMETYNGDGVLNTASAPTVSDTTPPAQTVNLSAPATGSGTDRTTTQVKWTWDSVPTATDYTVYYSTGTCTHADGEVGGISTTNATSYTRTTLTANTQHCIHVHATNANGAGESSDSSASAGHQGLAVHTLSTQATTPASATPAHNASPDGYFIDLSWTAPAPGSSFNKFRAYRFTSGAPCTGASTLIHEATATTKRDNLLNSDTTYCYQIRSTNAENIENNVDAPVTVSATTPSDQVAPTSAVTTPAHNSFVNAVPQIAGTANDDLGGKGVEKVEASIKRLSDNLYWNGSLWAPGEAWLATSCTTACSTSNTTHNWAKTSGLPSGSNKFEDGVSYITRSKATDRSASVNVETPGSGNQFLFDSLPPTKPGTPTIITGTNPGNTGTYTLSWSPSTDPGGSGLAGYRLYRNGSLIANLNNSTTTYNEVNIAEGKYIYSVVAHDNATNQTQSNDSAQIVVDKTIPITDILTPLNGASYNAANWPARIFGTGVDSGGSGLTKVEALIFDQTAKLFWNGTAWQDDLIWLPVDGLFTWQYPFLFTSLTNEHKYKTFSRGTDAAGNMEDVPLSVIFSASLANSFIFDITPPSEFNILEPSAGAWVNTLTPKFVWTAATDNLRLRDYSVFVDGNRYAVATAPATNVTGTSNLNEGQHSWYVIVADAADNQTRSKDEFNFGIDATAPSIPSNLRVFTSSDKQRPFNPDKYSQVLYFEWDAPRDNLSGIDGYWVYFGTDSEADPQLDGSLVGTNNFTAILDEQFSARLTQPVYAQERLSNYYLKIKSKDKAGNTSPTWNAFSHPKGVYRQGFLALLRESILDIARKTPKPVAYATPYILILILLALAWLAVRQTKTEVSRVLNLSAVLKRETTLAEEKDNFLMLASHYLRTPVAIMNGGVEQIAEEGQKSAARIAIASLARSMAQSVNQLIQDVSKSSYLQDIRKPNIAQEALNAVISPFFILPVASIAALIIGVNAIFLEVGKISASRANFATQIAVYIFAGAVLYTMVRRRHVQKQKRENLQRLLAHEVVLDTARNQFIKKSKDTIGYQLEKLEDEVKTMPKTHGTTLIMAGKDRLKAVMDKFITLTAIEAGKLKRQHQTFSADEVVRDVLEDEQKTIKVKKLRTKITGTKQLSQDKAKVRTILSALLENAVKFSSNRSKISATIKADGNDQTEIVINDSGRGINKEDLARLFKPFSRARPTALTDEGLGMGLYMSKMLANYLGGDIVVNSPGPHKGTTVTLRLPNSNSA